MFTQNDFSQCYQIRLINLRRILEGVKYLSIVKKSASNVDSPTVQETEKIPDAILNFFNDIDCQVVGEIDSSHKIIKYNFKRRYSEDSNDFSGYANRSQEEIYMFVSY